MLGIAICFCVILNMGSKNICSGLFEGFDVFICFWKSFPTKLKTLIKIDFSEPGSITNVFYSTSAFEISIQNWFLWNERRVMSIWTQKKHNYNYNFGCWRATPTIIIIPVWGWNRWIVSISWTSPNSIIVYSIYYFRVKNEQGTIRRLTNNTCAYTDTHTHTHTHTQWVQSGGTQSVE